MEKKQWNLFFSRKLFKIFKSAANLYLGRNPMSSLVRFKVSPFHLNCVGGFSSPFSKLNLCSYLYNSYDMTYSTYVTLENKYEFGKIISPMSIKSPACLKLIQCYPIYQDQDDIFFRKLASCIFFGVQMEQSEILIRDCMTK